LPVYVEQLEPERSAATAKLRPAALRHPGEDQVSKMLASVCDSGLLDGVMLD
jgi:hypothetical protein